jgi:hypothetical protein
VADCEGTDSEVKGVVRERKFGAVGLYQELVRPAFLVRHPQHGIRDIDCDEGPRFFAGQNARPASGSTAEVEHKALLNLSQEREHRSLL